MSYSYVQLKQWTENGKTFVEYQIYLDGMPVYKLIKEMT